jgi:hypothetical protein
MNIHGLKHLRCFQCVYLLSAFLIALSGGGIPYAQAQTTAEHQVQLSRLNYLLAIDRLDFYSLGLADYLEK